MMKFIQRTITKKFIIISLLILSLSVTSNTFAYWAMNVNGDNGNQTSTFTIGTYTINNYAFTLSNSQQTYSYLVPIADLLADPVNTSDDIEFGIIWNDPNVTGTTSGNITVTYNIKLFDAGTEITGNKYDRYVSLINLQVDPSNPQTITYNEVAQGHNFTVSLNPENRRNDYRNLGRYDVFIEITYTVTN